MATERKMQEKVCFGGISKSHTEKIGSMPDFGKMCVIGQIILRLYHLGTVFFLQKLCGYTEEEYGSDLHK